MTELEDFKLFPNSKFHLKKYYAILFTGFICIESWSWLPYVIEWSSTHCFIDDFISVTNPVNTYVTSSITTTDILLIDYFIGLDESVIIKVIFIAIAFYNTAICISLYIIYVIIFKK